MTRLTREDLAQNPRLRAAVADALAHQIDVRNPDLSRAPKSARPDAPQAPGRTAGRAGTHRCAICQLLHPSYAAAERHADTHGGGRIALTEIEPE